METGALGKRSVQHLPGINGKSIQYKAPVNCSFFKDGFPPLGESCQFATGPGARSGRNVAVLV